jgi:translation initiation factor 2B subunit (eIF-2B alpha/beta/delta family)
VSSEPTVADVVEDTEHGSAWISTRALEVLRRHAEGADELTTVAALARKLRESHPDMAALANRINRAMTRATSLGGVDDPAGTPAAVVSAAEQTLSEARRADEAAAAQAATLLGDDATVATLSRSGTVFEALVEAEPAVLIGESRPAGEGGDVAAELAAAGVEVTLTTDAALPWALADDAASSATVDAPAPDVVLVGADAVLPNGTVINKVGTRALGLAASRAGVALYAVAARDKIAIANLTPSVESDSWPLGVDSAVRTWTPTFDRTPPDCVDGIVTEAGGLATNEIRDVAEQHRRDANWDGGAREGHPRSAEA